MSDIIFNIHGGNNQIAPNATHATQNINTSGDSEAKQYTQAEVVSPLHDTILGADDEVPNEAQRLTLYINRDTLPQYLNQINACQSATELAKVIVNMQQEEPRLAAEEIVKERFIKQILFFAHNLQKGTTISNVRARINDAWEKRSKNSK